MENHPNHVPPAADPLPERRAFFHWLAYGLGAVAAGLAGVPFVGYVFGTQKRTVQWVDLGPAKKFPLNETRVVTFDNPIQTPWDGKTAQTAVFVRNESADQQQGEKFLVLAVNCAHLGCPVSWFPQSGLFMCPCHGGVYYANGERASGPPPRGMFHCVSRVRGGKLEIQAPHFPTLQDTETSLGATGSASVASSADEKTLAEPVAPEREDLRMTGRLNTIGRWLDARLFVRETLMPMLQHPVPRAIAGPLGWWYVFGSAALTLFIIQVLTGIGLAFVYVPSADRAYESLLYLNYEQPLGWFLRALHYYAGSGMVVLVLVHMTQVFLHGAYKYPRELTWIVGVFLLLAVLGMFFTGQVLRWDPDAYWGLAVGGSMAGRVPAVGPQVVHGVLGGSVIGGTTLSRFFALHVFIIPAVMFGLLAIHLWLVLKRGISAPPVPGETVDPRTYDREYEKQLREGVPFLGEAMLKDVLFSALVVIAVVLIAAIVGPKGPTGPVDPSLSGANPRPEWPFLWLFALLSLSPPGAETFVILVFPVLLVVALLLVPFLSNRGERAPSRRPVAVLSMIVIYTLLGILTHQGVTSDWSPAMNAWSGDPVPARMIESASPNELMGAAVFQNKNCRNCHALDGIGGRRGPDLSTVGSRLTRDELIDQISDGTPGGGNMPAYGRQMSPAEMTTLADFLVGLRPEGEPAAHTATGPAGSASTERKSP